MSSTASTPGDQGDDLFYDRNPLEPNQLFQGEILLDIPFLTKPKPPRWLLLRSAKTGRRLDEALQHGNIGGTVKVLDSNQSAAEWQPDGKGDFAVAVLDKAPSLVLTQTCDIENKNFIQLAPIYEAQVNDIEALKRDEVYSAFWIPPRPPRIPRDSYADLELVQSVHKSYIKRFEPENHVRLTASRIRQLQRVLTRYFGRPNSYDSRDDRVPRTATYLCVACFYFDGVVSRVNLTEGDQFPPCSRCNSDRSSWVIQGR